MKNENILKWADMLITTTEAQGTGWLCEMDGYGVRSYCCLGLGTAKLVPGIHIRAEEGQPEYIYTPTPMAMGVAERTSLAPVEFINWLGLRCDEVDEGEVPQFDVWPDWPTDLRIRPTVDRPLGSGLPRLRSRLSLPHDDYQFAVNDRLSDVMSCASLNDNGFTFQQIGELIKHFGLREWADER